MLDFESMYFELYGELADVRDTIDDILCKYENMYIESGVVKELRLEQTKNTELNSEEAPRSIAPVCCPQAEIVIGDSPPAE